VSIEILFDPVEECVESGLLMDERHEVLPEGDWIRAVNRITGRSDLFVYRHAWTEKFVVAQWLSREPPVCLELETMDLPPDRGGWISLGYMEQRCISAVAMRRRVTDSLKRVSRDRRDLRMESAEEKRDVRGWLRRRRGEDAAAIMMDGPGRYVGQREGGERLEEAKDEVRRMVKVT
jgi:hypothetical protein